MTLYKCTRQNTCYDCDNEKCTWHGDKGADCPKYKCDRDMDCEHCEFIDEFIEEERKKYARQKRLL